MKLFMSSTIISNGIQSGPPAQPVVLILKSYDIQDGI